MKHRIRGGLAAILVLLPFAAKEYIPRGWQQIFAVVLVAAIAYLATSWDLKPDNRIDRIRKVVLKEKLDKIFARAIKSLKGNQRLPFRANLMVPKRRWCMQT